MKIAFASLGAYGHVYPMMPLALACAEAGHEVVVAVGDPFLGRLALPTVPGGQSDATLARAAQQTRRTHPELTGYEFTAAMFADAMAGSVISTLVGELTRFGPDLVVYEGMDSGAAVAAGVLGVPAVAFAIGLSRFVYDYLHRETLGFHRGEWTSRGLTPPNELVPLALVDPAPPTLVGQGGMTSAPRLPIRSVGYSEPSAGVPDWLTAARTRPRVYLTLGTVSFGAVDVITRALAEIAALEVEVLVTVGPEGDPAALGDQPRNVHVERFVAQSRVLPLVDVAVHHGGTGTVLSALECGLPQLLLPQGADQFVNATMLTTVGAARALPAEAQQPGVISDAVRALLGDAPEGTVAGTISAEIAQLPEPAAVVADLVVLARGAA